MFNSFGDISTSLSLMFIFIFRFVFVFVKLAVMLGKETQGDEAQPQVFIFNIFLQKKLTRIVAVSK